MYSFKNIRGHLHTINAHKLKVMELCFACGLYRQGLLHDLSKYTPQELRTGFRYYQGYRSPINAQKEQEGYSMSWLHHKGKNPHHWEYWLDNGPNGVHAVAMPFNYVVEMFCDRVAATMIYEKEDYTDASALKYYLLNQEHVMIHPDTERQIIAMLRHLRIFGLDNTITWIRTLLAQWRKTGKVDL